MSRLTKLDKYDGGYWVKDKYGEDRWFSPKGKLYKPIEKLAHYEDLEEQLENLFGGKLPLEKVVETLKRTVQNGEEKLDYTRILTNAEAEKWDKWKDLEEQGRLIEQKHGRWKIIGMRPVGTHLTHYCSICGGHGDNEMDYCPNCGAKMGEVEE